MTTEDFHQIIQDLCLRLGGKAQQTAHRSPGRTPEEEPASSPAITNGTTTIQLENWGLARKFAKEAARKGLLAKIDFIHQAIQLEMPPREDGHERHSG